MRSVSWEQAKIAAHERFGEKTDQGKIAKTMESLIAAVKREAGNMPIQGTGADMMLLAMGCGFDKSGKPYLWHILEPEYGAMLLNYVYDEFVVESPEEHSAKVDEVVGDAIIRAGGEFVKVVPMESEGMISKRWQK
jgi:DNA polymerase I-like protein with 3'-5' exonuclease and polymerase domains